MGFGHAGVGRLEGDVFRVQGGADLVAEVDFVDVLVVVWG